ncbi:Epidermis-specific secreted glycoprotein EP1 [Carex littledalei]|uniref:non-specific serine/threonine protein kinase n=1 Tax=Carex littledalei TaxID=544730 RepID=A0A833RGV1_9POAL|nr:Epidermis-specific secreted glycoprotein EP1 [Carex littledalei]
MAFTSNLITFVVLLLCFSFSVNPQPYFNPTASAPVSWTNTPSDLTYNYMFSGGEIVNSLLLRLNVTHGLSFATGFYCFPPCKSYFLSIYIVFAYNDQPGYYPHPPQVIWSANRARPVSENATLQLTSQDGLTLRDSDGSLVWSTSGLNRSVAGINITEAGNLVLFDINLLELNNVTYFSDGGNVGFNTTGEESCKRACLRDCKCKAALFQSSNANLSDGKCLTLSEVFSFKNEPDADFQSTIYIKAYLSARVFLCCPLQAETKALGEAIAYASFCTDNQVSLLFSLGCSDLRRSTGGLIRTCTIFGSNSSSKTLTSNVSMSNDTKTIWLTI